MENEFEKELTYVLFGAEAIQLCKASLKLLKSSTDVSYKVESYNDVKEFVKETKNWDGFLEISKDDYLELKKNSLKFTGTETHKPRKRKKFSFSNFFK